MAKARVGRWQNWIPAQVLAPSSTSEPCFLPHPPLTSLSSALEPPEQGKGSSGHTWVTALTTILSAWKVPW